MKMNNLKQLSKLGQQIWLDSLSRTLLSSNQLANMLEEDGISGLTSNPAIFQQAFAKDVAYTEQIAKLQKTSLSNEQRFEELAIPDIQAACDLFRPMYDGSRHEQSLAKGLVSFEVSPTLANDAQGTISAAKRLWERIARPNAMIKIPATNAGLVAIREVIAAGINVNVTLMFSPRHVADVFTAYRTGLEQRTQQGLSVREINSVASVFISRVDTRLDSKLPAVLQGKIAIAAAKQAYQYWQAYFAPQGQFKALADNGARAQALLWASTGTKNPAYSDVVYVESLIGGQTVNTVPEATLNAFRDHGNAQLSLTLDTAEAAEQLAQLRAAGIDLDAEGEILQQEGLRLFEEAFAKLLQQLD